MVCTYLWAVAVIQFAIASGRKLDPGEIVEMDNRQTGTWFISAMATVTCDEGLPETDIGECEKAAMSLGFTYGGELNDANYAKYCYKKINKFYFNKHATGQASSSRFPVCRVNPTTTTTTPTTTPTTTSMTTTLQTTTADQGQLLQTEPNCTSDVGYVVDASGNVGSHWGDEKAFVNRLAHAINISPTEGHASLVMFSSEQPGVHPDAQLMIKFSDHPTYSGFESAVNALPYWGGYSLIEAGLTVALTQMFHVDNGMRPWAPKTVVLITEGQQPAVDYPAWKHAFHDAGIKFVVVGTGNVDPDDLGALVEDESDLHLAKNYELWGNNSFIENISLCDDPHTEQQIIVTCSQWFNTQHPWTNGASIGGKDWETISWVTGIHPSAIECPTSYMIQAKVNDSILLNSADVLSSTGNQVLFNYNYPPASLAGTGLICDSRPHTWANNGAEQICQDYSVRFCCH